MTGKGVEIYIFTYIYIFIHFGLLCNIWKHVNLLNTMKLNASKDNWLQVDRTGEYQVKQNKSEGERQMLDNLTPLQNTEKQNNQRVKIV